MGGTPGNALSLGWQQCYDGRRPRTAGDQDARPGDTYWLNDVALQTVERWLSTNPDIKGYAYEYADGMNTALQAYKSSASRSGTSPWPCGPTSRPCSATGRS